MRRISAHKRSLPPNRRQILTLTPAFTSRLTQVVLACPSLPSALRSSYSFRARSRNSSALRASDRLAILAARSKALGDGGRFTPPIPVLPVAIHGKRFVIQMGQSEGSRRGVSEINQIVSDKLRNLPDHSLIDKGSARCLYVAKAEVRDSGEVPVVSASTLHSPATSAVSVT